MKKSARESTREPQKKTERGGPSASLPWNQGDKKKEKVSLAGGLVKREEKQVVETMGIGKDGVIKAQGRMRRGGEGRKTKKNHKRRSKKEGCKKMEWWKRSKDWTKKFSKEKKTDKERRKGRRGRGRKNWMEYGEHGKMIGPPVDDRAKFGGSQCGVGKCPEQ